MLFKHKANPGTRSRNIPAPSPAPRKASATKLVMGPLPALPTGTMKIRTVSAPTRPTAVVPPARGTEITREMPAMGFGADGTMPGASWRNTHDAVSDCDWPDLTGSEQPTQEITNLAARVADELEAPSMASAVKHFRAARDLAHERRTWLDKADARLREQDARMAEFAARWARFDASVEAAKQRQQVAALTRAYEDGGTNVALYKVQELARMIAADAAGSNAPTQIMPAVAA